ncbi:MAG TPA: FMN-binding protein, partial [Albitalea sp.]|nr:FMN-binding protein [Albitalea sp.]
LAAAVTALAPASAFAVDYLSAEQAAQLMFPEADHFDSRELTLDAARLQQLDAQGVRARSARWDVRVAQRAGATLGFVVVDNVIGKFELITYAVGIGADGAIKQVEVLSYRESHGQEIRLPAWRRQFVGKTAASTLRNGEDIANISGATLSCAHVTEGVKRIVAVVALARRVGSLP